MEKEKELLGISEIAEIPRPVINIFFLLDTSESMQDEPIAQLNCAMLETEEAIKDSARNNGDVQIRMAVMEFNSNVRWMRPAGPENIESFEWEILTASGIANVGKALNELDSKLSPNSFLERGSGNYLPIIVFMTNGHASDEYQKALEEIRKNKWFLRAAKIGFAIGDNPNIAMISEVVGDTEAVFRTMDLFSTALFREINFLICPPGVVAIPSEIWEGADNIHEIEYETEWDSKISEEWNDDPEWEIIDDEWI